MVRVNVTSAGQNTSVAITPPQTYYDNLSKKWAISEEIVEGEDYSSKHYAQESKAQADIATTKAQEASESATTAENTITTGIANVNSATSTALSDIENKRSSAIAEIEEKQTEAINTLSTGLSDIDNAKTEAISTIQAQETTSKKAIEDKTQEALAQIPTVAEVANKDLSNLTETGENKIKTIASTSATWGNIQGTLANQADLNNVINSMVNITGDQTIAGVKTFSSTIVGDLQGNATSATKASQDGEGNNIVNTYATKTELNAKTDTSLSNITDAGKQVIKDNSLDINNYQVNNVYSYGMSQYYKGVMNNNSWLRSAGQWNSGTVYNGVYDWAVAQQVAGVEGFKLSTEEYTDYDWVINTEDETFRLPIKNGQEGMFASTSATSVPVVGNGLVAKLSSITVPSGYKLYYYIGDTVQNADLINIARLGEDMVDWEEKLVDIKSRPHIEAVYVNGTSGYRIWSADNTGYRYCEQWGVASNIQAGTVKGINLMRAYIDDKYNIFVNQTYNWGQTSNIGNYIIAICAGTTTDKFYIKTSNGPLGAMWRTCGYIA